MTLVFQENLSAHSELSASSDSLSKNKVRSSSCCSGSRDNVTWNFNVHTEICDKWARAYCSCLSQGKKLRYAGMLKKLPKQAKAESDQLENLIKHSLTPMMFFITTQTKIFVSGPAVPAWWLTQLQWWSDCSPVKGEDHLILSWCNSN